MNWPLILLSWSEIASGLSKMGNWSVRTRLYLYGGRMQYLIDRHGIIHKMSREECHDLSGLMIGPSLRVLCKS